MALSAAYPVLDDLTVARARRGDAAALRAFVERFERPVFALVGRLLAGRRQAVEDVAQDAFLRVVRGLPRFDPAGPASLSTWVLTITARTCLTWLRDRGREAARIELPAAPPPEPASTDADPERRAAGREIGRQVETAMAALPEDMRAVLVLRAYHDFDYPEIADALGIEIGTVKSRLARARMALRAAIAFPAPRKENSP